jgi:hypothetical protein
MRIRQTWGTPQTKGGDSVIIHAYDSAQSALDHEIESVLQELGRNTMALSERMAQMEYYARLSAIRDDGRRLIAALHRAVE